MSNARRLRRENERESQKHFLVLGELLTDFYSFLESKSQPSDEEVRSTFIAKEKEWKRYCKKNNLNEKASLLFNNEVAMSWKTRYAKKQ